MQDHLKTIGSWITDVALHVLSSLVMPNPVRDRLNTIGLWIWKIMACLAVLSGCWFLIGEFVMSHFITTRLICDHAIVGTFPKLRLTEAYLDCEVAK